MKDVDNQSYEEILYVLVNKEKVNGCTIFLTIDKWNIPQTTISLRDARWYDPMGVHIALQFANNLGLGEWEYIPISVRVATIRHLQGI